MIAFSGMVLRKKSIQFTSVDLIGVTMSIKVIALSGIDGCGKSTQIELLEQYFITENIRYKVIWARPGSTSFVLLMKAIARFFFRSLPKPGRSEEREGLMKNSSMGRLWFYLTFLELIYIYKIKARIITMFNYKVIFDRHTLDSVIDYQILLERNLFGKWVVTRFLGSDKNCIKICLDISLDESFKRCNNKWEPFPDTKEEKVIRDSIYREYLPLHGYITLDGTRNGQDLHKNIISLIGA